MITRKSALFCAATLALATATMRPAWAGKYDINMVQTPNFGITDDDNVVANPNSKIIITTPADAEPETKNIKTTHKQTTKHSHKAMSFNCARTTDISVMLSSRCLNESEENDFEDNGDEPSAISELEAYEEREREILSQDQPKEHKIPRISCIEHNGLASQKNAEECLASGGRTVFVPGDNLFKPYESYYNEEVVQQKVDMTDGESLNTPKDTTYVSKHSGVLCNGVVLYPSGITHGFSDELKNARICIAQSVSLLKMKGSQEIINLVMPNELHNRVQCTKSDKVTCKLL